MRGASSYQLTPSTRLIAQNTQCATFEIKCGESED
jgi:hypothetical protein